MKLNDAVNGRELPCYHILRFAVGGSLTGLSRDRHDLRRQGRGMEYGLMQREGDSERRNCRRYAREIEAGQRQCERTRTCRVNRHRALRLERDPVRGARVLKRQENINDLVECASLKTLETTVEL